MISRIAVLPQPPLLVPELMGTSPRSSEPLREACLRAVSRLADVGRDWVALGTAATATSIPPEAGGSFRGYGADVPVALSDDAGAAGAGSDFGPIPLPALMAGWLRQQAGAGAVRVELVAETASRQQCQAAAEDLRTAGESALLVLGDGSNRRGLRAPGGHDDRAAPFDAAVSAALASVDIAALLDLDATLAAQLGAGGRAPWQALAALAEGGAWHGELLYSGAPFGVGYHVAVWERR